MFATSIAPAVEAEVEVALQHLARSASCSSGACASSSFGSERMAEPRLVAAGDRVVEVVEAPLRLARRAAPPGTTRACRRVWFERDVADDAHAARVRRARSERSASSPPSSGSTCVEASSRRSGASSPPGRTASGRSRFAPSDSMWSRCCSIAAQVAAEQLARRRLARGPSAARPSRGGTAQSGALDGRAPDDAKRSGKIW